MTSLPAHPYISGGTSADNSITTSTYGVPTAPTDTNGALIIRGDFALWDSTAGVFVSLHTSNVNIGTTTYPKL